MSDKTQETFTQRPIVVTPEYRAKIQETADKCHVPIYIAGDGTLHHLKPGDSLPLGAELFKPSKPWPAPSHGSDVPAPEAPAT